MGKKQHSKDRLYITTKEWAEEWGGHRKTGSLPFSKLPFYCCAISFTPFEDPVCSPDGCVFDIVNAVPYIRKYHKNPVNGESLELKDLTQLTFHKNAEGEYHCPVMNKVFTEHTHIVAVKTTGNVYCYEAILELNIKPKNWKELLTDDAFQKSDIIHLQDPLSVKNRVLSQFDHVTKGWEVPREDADDGCFRNVDSDTKRILKSLGTKEAKAAFEGGGGGKREQARQLLAQVKTQKRLASQATEKPKMVFKPGASTWDTQDHLHGKDNVRKKRQRDCDKKKDSFDPNGSKESPSDAYAPHVEYRPGLESTGAMASGLTSTVMAPVTKNPRKLVRVDRCPKKKGYVRLHTTLGHLNVELHCDLVPRTCENFIGLCEMGYFDDTLFHRSIRDFMIQGGDPTGTGKGGESIYGPTFRDELDSRLTHSTRGVLSMANSGQHTNGSQFFILFKAASHLDQKHTVFGKLVGGTETLSAMEAVQTDDEDRPVEDIRILRVSVFCNPYREMVEEEKEAGTKLPKEDPKGSWFSDPGFHSKEREEATETHLGVGRYLKKRHKPAVASSRPAPAKNVQGGSFGNFSAW